LTEEFKMVLRHYDKKWETKLRQKSLGDKTYFWILVPTKVEQMGLQAEKGISVEIVFKEFSKFLEGKIASNTIFKDWEISLERIKSIKKRK